MFSPNLTKICCWLPLVGASVAAKGGYDFGFLQRVLQPPPPSSPLNMKSQPLSLLSTYLSWDFLLGELRGTI